MTTTANPLRADSTGNGVGLNHPYTWKINAKTELLVTKVTDATGAEQTLTVDVDYTVTGIGSESGGNVVINPALPSGFSLVITPNVQYKQDADFTNQNSVPPAEVESALDKLSVQIKQMAEIQTRTVTVKVGLTPTELQITSAPADGYGLVWDGTDGELRNTTASLATLEGNAQTVASNISDINTVATDLNGTDTIGTVATDLSGSDTIGTVAGAIANVNAVGGSITNVNTVATNIANVNAVAADATDIGTVATNIANVNTVAGISANVTTVAGISANVSTVAGDSGDINTLSGISADIQTLADIEDGTVATTAISDLAAIDSNITTVAGISANVTSVAGNSSNINTVAGSISNVNTVAGAITNVNTVATNISGVNSFAERYRVAASDPATSLDQGDLAYNTTSNILKYYNGSAWVGISPGITSVADDSTPQLGGNLDVNGNSIVSASNGNIPITPNGTGKVILDGLNWPTADGSADQLLKTDGAGNLSFVDAAGGGAWTEISRQTVTSAVSSVDFTGLDDTYDLYKLVILGANGSNGSSSNEQVAVRLRLESGSTWITSGYDVSILRVESATPDGLINTYTSGYLASALKATDAEGGVDSVVYFSNLRDTSVNSRFLHQTSVVWGGAERYYAGMVTANNANAIDGIRALLAGGSNWVQGTFILLGA